MNRHAIWAAAAIVGVGSGVLVGSLLPPENAPSTTMAAHAWVHRTNPGQGTAPLYITVSNRTPRSDALFGAYVPSGVAEAAEFHARSTKLASIDLPAHQTARLQPGRAYITLVGVAHPLRPGDQFPLTLEFWRSPEQTVTVKVDAS